jgi:protein ImuB
MFAVIHLPQFTLQAALRHEPELWARPIALVDPALNTPRVCDATSAARAFGVTEGLTPTQALARCREVLIRHRAPTQEAAATEAILQCAYGFSPNIESTSAGTVTLDLRGLSELQEDEERTRLRLSLRRPRRTRPPQNR